MSTHLGKIVLSYHDSLLREEDVELLEPPNWLNDKIIGFYFEYLEKEVFHGQSERICFITPDVTQFIKLYKGSEIAVFLEPLCLSRKDLIILSINSSSSKTSAGGSHWSTLVYIRSVNKFEHYDSLGSSNAGEALGCSLNLTEFLQVDPKPDFREVPCQQQENSYDCGVFCVLFAEHVAREKLFIPSKSVNKAVTLETVAKWRKQTQELIKRLKSSC